MEQEELFHEDLREALRHCIAALGGTKRVASELWPSHTMDQARARLNNCLDANRPEKLDLEELLYILKTARQIKCHAAMAYLLDECGYSPPVAVEPEDEAAALQREFNNSVKLQRAILARMERIELPKVRSVS